MIELPDKETWQQLTDEEKSLELSFALDNLKDILDGRHQLQQAVKINTDAVNELKLNIRNFIFSVVDWEKELNAISNEQNCTTD